MFGYLKSRCGPLVIVTQGIHLDRFRPRLAVKNRILGNDGDVGVDQGSATETRALNDTDVLLSDKFVKAERAKRTHEVLQGLERFVGKVSRNPFQSPSENADAGFGPNVSSGDPSGGDRPSVAGANNHHIVFGGAARPQAS